LEQTTETTTPEVRGDYTIAEMRSMLGGDKAPPAADEGDKKPEAKSAPDSGTEKQKAGKLPRAEDGKEPENAEDKELPEGVQKRIGKALKAQRDAERKNAELQKELEELRKPAQAAGAKKAEQKKEPPKADKQPEAGDFTSYDDYVIALTKWGIRQERESSQKADADKKAAEALKARQTVWSEKKDRARTLHPDLDDVLEAMGDTPLSQAVHNAITESDIGPQLAYYLATHTDEAARISKLNPFLAMKEMGRLEDKLAPSTAEKDKPQTPAKKELPKPARAVTGTTTTAREQRLDDPDLPLDEFKRMASSHFRRSR
jgi:hypothetical protein